MTCVLHRVNISMHILTFDNLYVLNVLNSCIHVLVLLALHPVVPLSSAVSQCNGQTDWAGGGSGDDVLPVGSADQQEPLPGWRCDFWWNF